MVRPIAYIYLVPVCVVMINMILLVAELIIITVVVTQPKLSVLHHIDMIPHKHSLNRDFIQFLNGMEILG